MMKTISTGKISDNLYAVNLGMVNFFIYTDGDYKIAIDCGFNFEKIQKEMNKINIKPEEITHLFLTHSDVDHAGGCKLFSNAKVFIGKNEDVLLKQKIKRSFTYNKDLNCSYSFINDGDIFEINKTKIKAVFTPGHTPGSMSYIINDTILFSGDIIGIKNGKAKKFVFFFNMDNKTQIKSVEKLLAIPEIKLICTAHTGVLKV